jgi:hypothetical protein
MQAIVGWWLRKGGGCNKKGGNVPAPVRNQHHQKASSEDHECHEGVREDPGTQERLTATPLYQLSETQASLVCSTSWHTTPKTPTIAHNVSNGNARDSVDIGPLSGWT